ncbi:sensor histidine kinase [Streptoalloteichus hindustanus]|uniref:histidine kinase n=1 Tax=Streptoalloteichus hindustanus TaxID=2017 RepID=A0A1M5F8N6_STRHI|nr:sensor histidine kinase [Streptoalloteichus hindustanus]SHF87431.1 Signal transduction histidine kinase [Streptoalloteichus hindustanus]
MPSEHQLSGSRTDTARLVLLLMGTGMLIAAMATARESSPWVWGGYAVSLVCWFLYLAWDRRRPGLAGAAVVLSAAAPALVSGVAADSTAMIMVCVVLGRFAAWVVPSARQLAAGIAACVGLTVASGAVAGRPLAELLESALFILLLTLLGLNHRQYHLRAEQAELLLRQSDLVRQEQARTSALHERARIAREIHDVLAHSLGALSVQLQVADALLEKGDVEASRERVRRCHQLAEDGLVEARGAVAALREDVPPLAVALADLAERFRQDHGGRIETRTTGAERPLSAGATVALVAVAREALTNATKHAPGARVEVSLAYLDDAVRLDVRNEMRGADLRPRSDREPGYGLRGMRERIALVGGTLDAEGEADGTHWRVTARLPE